LAVATLPPWYGDVLVRLGGRLTSVTFIPASAHTSMLIDQIAAVKSY
jgi:hypothetical protein